MPQEAVFAGVATPSQIDAEYDPPGSSIVAAQRAAFLPGMGPANLHAADIFYEHAKHGRPHPHLCLRSHSHKSADSHDAHPVRYVALGAWQLKTAFGHKIYAGKFADVGGLIAHCDDHLEARRVMYPPDPSPVWEASS